MKFYYLVAVTLFLTYQLTSLAKANSVPKNGGENDEDDTSANTVREQNGLQKTCNTVIGQMDEHLDIGGIHCQTNAICRKNFKISGINLLPYSINLEVEELLFKCCGRCVNFTEIHFFDSTKEVTSFSIQSSDFVFPILARESTKRLYGFHYAPFINARKPVYITRKREGQLWNFVLQLYPFMAICLLMAIIAGFIAWVIECRSNEGFPTPFVSGLFEGFWWSFVTMTTVGYGDLVMKSVPGKIFAVIWILFGIVGFGLLTGELTTHIMELKNPQIDELRNANVGVLNDRQYDTFVTSRHGGVVVLNANVTDFYSDVLKLLEKLKEKEIDGILFDLYTLKYITREMLHANTTYWEKVRTFFLTETVRDRKGYEGETLTYGMLIKHKKDYEYFKDSIAEERLRIELTWDYNWNAMEHNGTEKFPAQASQYYSFSYFNYTLFTIVGVLGLTVIYGVVYEIRRRKRARAQYQYAHGRQEPGEMFDLHP